MEAREFLSLTECLSNASAALGGSVRLYELHFAMLCKRHYIILPLRIKNVTRNNGKSLRNVKDNTNNNKSGDLGDAN